MQVQAICLNPITTVNKISSYQTDHWCDLCNSFQAAILDANNVNHMWKCKSRMESYIQYYFM